MSGRGRTSRSFMRASDVLRRAARTLFLKWLRVVRGHSSLEDPDMRRRIAVLLLATVAPLAGCREGDGPADPSLTDARVYLKSAPAGAHITVDNRSTGQITPDTIALRRGDRTIELELDSAGLTYGYRFILRVEPSDTVVEVEVPVGLQCITPDGTCFQAARQERAAAGLRFATSGVGSLFHWGGAGSGIFWPGASANSYASSGMPVFAGIAQGAALALGIYDQSMLVGRPAPVATEAGGVFRLQQQAWVLPPPTPLVDPATVTGLLIEQELIGDAAVDGVLVVRLTFRNVSDDPLVHLYAPFMPAAAVTYTDAWIGFALDPDIGTAADDWLSYDPALDMVFAYDADFAAPFGGPDASQPGLVGLSVLDAPAGTDVQLNAWYQGFDWSAGRVGEESGYGMLSGSDIFAPDHADEKVGHMPPTAGDLRMSVTAGPLTLAPGEEARIVIAVAIAPPVGGTFTSGAVMVPGDPFDTSRPLYQTAANLRAKISAAATVGN